MRSQEISDRLLDMIYDAATDDGLWTPIFREIASLTNSVGGVLLCQSEIQRTIFFERQYGTDEACLRNLKERHVLNPWTLYMRSRHPVGVVVPSDRVLPLAELQRTAFFDEVLGPQKLGHSAMIGLAQKQDFGVGFSMNRGPRQGPYDEQELRFLRKLAPHLYRSIQLALRVDAYKALQRAEYHALDHLAIGVVLLDRDARLIFANAAARSLDGEGQPLRLRHERIGTFSPPQSRRLDRLVQSALRGMPMAAISVPRPDDGIPLTVLASSVRGQDVERFAAGHLKGAAVILFIVDPAGKAAIPAAWLTDAYGLTQAEASVAVAASMHGTVAETASQLNLSPNTVKTHLRHVFAKTGVSRRTELSSLMAALRMVRGA